MLGGVGLRRSAEPTGDPMTITRRAVLKSMTATSALAAASRLGAPAIAQAKPCKLGILVPRTGIAASPGISGLRANEWAVGKLHAAGGIAGRPNVVRV